MALTPESRKMFESEILPRFLREKLKEHQGEADRYQKRLEEVEAANSKGVITPTPTITASEDPQCAVSKTSNGISQTHENPIFINNDNSVHLELKDINFLFERGGDKNNYFLKFNEKPSKVLIPDFYSSDKAHKAVEQHIQEHCSEVLHIPYFDVNIIVCDNAFNHTQFSEVIESTEN